jgi:hypothetical protein
LGILTQFQGKKNPQNLATLTHFSQKILLGIAPDFFSHQVPLPKKDCCSTLATP